MRDSNVKRSKFLLKYWVIYSYCTLVVYSKREEEEDEEEDENENKTLTQPFNNVEKKSKVDYFDLLSKSLPSDNTTKDKQIERTNSGNDNVIIKKNNQNGESTDINNDNQDDVKNINDITDNGNKISSDSKNNHDALKRNSLKNTSNSQEKQPNKIQDQTIITNKNEMNNENIKEKSSDQNKKILNITADESILVKLANKQSNPEVNKEIIENVLSNATHKDMINTDNDNFKTNDKTIRYVIEDKHMEENVNNADKLNSANKDKINDTVIKSNMLTEIDENKVSGSKCNDQKQSDFYKQKLEGNIIPSDKMSPINNQTIKNEIDVNQQIIESITANKKNLLNEKNIKNLSNNDKITKTKGNIAADPRKITSDLKNDKNLDKGTKPAENNIQLNGQNLSNMIDNKNKTGQIETNQVKEIANKKTDEEPKKLSNNIKNVKNKNSELSDRKGNIVADPRKITSDLKNDENLDNTVPGLSHEKRSNLLESLNENVEIVNELENYDLKIKKLKKNVLGPNKLTDVSLQKKQQVGWIFLLNKL
jgi:translation initiation factor 4G